MNDAPAILSKYRVTGKLLARRAGIRVEDALYRRTGDWYHIVRNFPAALFDQAGFIFFADAQSYLEFLTRVGVRQYDGSNTLTVSNGISSFSDYMPFALHLAEEILDGPAIWEGAKETIIVNSFERDRSARAACIRHWGLSCSVCSMDFGVIYGECGSGFIHVHHLVPLKDIRKSYRVDPINDLRPVCPNCHAMLHRDDPPLLIEKLKEMILYRRNMTARKSLSHEPILTHRQ